MTGSVPARHAGPWPHVRAVLFDFGGTLDAEGVPWKERFFRLWREESSPIAPDRFDAAFYAADDALVGTIPRDLSLGETVDRLARGVANRLGADPAAGARVADRFLGVVSNFYGNLAAVCRENGLLVHLAATVDSCEEGCSKPEPGIFRAALAKLGTSAAETLFVGDSRERDMAGARAVGMPHVRLATALSDGDLCCPGDRVIRRVADLEELLA
jgi:FMN phosphatase YigB (HAD superfamily)